MKEIKIAYGVRGLEWIIKTKPAIDESKKDSKK